MILLSNSTCCCMFLFSINLENWAGKTSLKSQNACFHVPSWSIRKVLSIYIQLEKLECAKAAYSAYLSLSYFTIPYFFLLFLTFPYLSLHKNSKRMAIVGPLDQFQMGPK